MVKEYYILTGNLVVVLADSEEQAMARLSEGDYEEIECQSEIKEVRGLQSWRDVAG